MDIWDAISMIGDAGEIVWEHDNKALLTQIITYRLQHTSCMSDLDSCTHCPRAAAVTGNV